MDWEECCKKRIVKEIKEDHNKISAMKRIAFKKFEGAKNLPIIHYYSIITLLYDNIRIFLEVISLKRGYKIYNHECYVSFLKEIMKESQLADEFDKLRIIRNSINYYGKEINSEEGKVVVNEMKKLIKELKKKFFI